MSWYNAVLFVLGLSFGSFFNVLILRYSPDGKLFDFRKLSGRSRCPKCLKTLTPGELIPLFSFLVLRGKCSSCGVKISWFYPFTEAVTGVLFAGAPLFINFFYGVPNAVFWNLTAPLWYYALVLSWLLVILSFLVIAIIDFRFYVVPDELNIVLFFLGAAITAMLSFGKGFPLLPFRESFLENYVLLFSPAQSVLWNHVLGAVIGGLFFYLLVILSRGRGIGFGDVKLAFASGAVIGWPDVGLSIFISFIVGGLVGAVLLLFQKKGMKDRIPYAPFLVLGVIATMLFGRVIIFNYFRLFGM